MDADDNDDESDQEESEEEEESDNEIVNPDQVAPVAQGAGALGNVQDDGEEDGEAGVDQDGAPVPAAQQQGNWLTFDQLMKETYPAKSKEIYLGAYRNFEIFLKSEKQYDPTAVPTETQLLNYFHYLKTIKGWKSTTIWSQYSRLNGVLKRRCSISLKNFPNITNLLKSYEVGHQVKKANVFSPQQE